jgi:hypothetical protein
MGFHQIPDHQQLHQRHPRPPPLTHTTADKLGGKELE